MERETDQKRRGIIEHFPIHLTGVKRKPTRKEEDEYYRYNAKIGDLNVSVDMGKGGATGSRHQPSINSEYVGKLYRHGLVKNENREIRVVQQYDVTFQDYFYDENTVLIQDESSQMIGTQFAQILRDLIKALVDIHSKAYKQKKLDKNSFLVSNDLRGHIMTVMRSDKEMTSFKEDFATLKKIVHNIFIKRIENRPRSLNILLDHIPNCADPKSLFTCLEKHPLFLNPKDRMTSVVESMLNYNDGTENDKSDMIKKLTKECESVGINVKLWRTNVLKDSQLSKFLSPNHEYFDGDVLSMFKYVRNFGVHHTEVKKNVGTTIQNHFKNRGTAAIEIDRVLPSFFDALFYAETCSVLISKNK